MRKEEQWLYIQMHRLGNTLMPFDLIQLICCCIMLGLHLIVSRCSSIPCSCSLAYSETYGKVIYKIQQNHMYKFIIWYTLMQQTTKKQLHYMRQTQIWIQNWGHELLLNLPIAIKCSFPIKWKKNCIWFLWMEWEWDSWDHYIENIIEAQEPLHWWPHDFLNLKTTNSLFH